MKKAVKNTLIKKLTSKSNMKKILLVTERRADYSRFKEILKEINNEDTLKYVLIVTGFI